ncbi:MAG: sulfur transferase domain-containing protein, partial [Pseudomonadota bacterium]|nr:sulfur transferase domain-containing protein [Pseudomonadota bacterium]
MEIRTIAPDLSVSPQITPQDVGLAASKGFRSIIVNRPDGESSDQTDYAQIEDAARR